MYDRWQNLCGRKVHPQQDRMLPRSSSWSFIKAWALCKLKLFYDMLFFFNLDRMRFRFAQFNIHQGLYCWISIFVFSILGFVQSRNWVCLFVGLIESSLISVSNLIPPSKFYNWASVKSYIESLFQYCFISWGIFFNIGIGAAYSLLCGFPDQRL